MNSQLRNVPLAGFLAASVLVGITSTVQAAAPNPRVQKTFDNLLSAIKTNNRDAFAAEGTDQVKQSLTQQAMDGLSKSFGPRLQTGYEATYLCQLKQGGLQVHLWKLSFKDGNDDVVVRVALKEGKVEGFFLQ